MTIGLWGAMIGSTLAWSGFDVIRKHLVMSMPIEVLAFWISLAQLPGYLLWALLEGNFRVEQEYWLPAFASVVLNLAANFLFLISVQRGALSVTVPVLSFTPVFAAILAGPLLGEHLVLSQWWGVGIVTVSSLFLTASPSLVRTPLQLFTSFAGSPGVPQMLGVALLWAASPIFDKLALRGAAVPIHGAVLALTGAVGMGLLVLFKGQGAQLKLNRPTSFWIAAGGLTNIAALGLQLVSITTMVVSVFEAFKRASGVLLALILGALFFHERISRSRAFAAVFIASGVILVLK